MEVFGSATFTLDDDAPSSELLYPEVSSRFSGVSCQLQLTVASDAGRSSSACRQLRAPGFSGPLEIVSNSPPLPGFQSQAHEGFETAPEVDENSPFSSGPP